MRSDCMILVTGGDGYIGENFIKKYPDETISYDIKHNQDILDVNLLESYMLSVDAVIHLAAISGIGACENGVPEAVMNNILGTLNVCSLAAKHGVKIIFSSSQAVHRDTLYGLSKRVGEKIVAYYGGTSLRFSNVYGGSNYLRLKDSAIARLNKGTWEDRGHDGEYRDFVHVNEVVKQIHDAIKQPRGIYDVCSGDTITIAELRRRFNLGMYHMEQAAC